MSEAVSIEGGEIRSSGVAGVQVLDAENPILSEWIARLPNPSSMLK
jgi:hypothetical protein